MAAIEDLIDDSASRFGLGPKAGQLVREVIHLMTSFPGGIGGFIEKLKAAGLGTEVASWLGRTDAPALAGPAIERAIGSNTLSAISGRLGLGSGVVAAAIGYLLPKLIGQTTPGGAIPAGLPASFSRFLQAAPAQTTTRRVEQVAPRAMTVIHDTPHLGRWLIPVLFALGVLGLFWYLLSGNQPATTVATSTPAPVPAAPAPIPSVPAHLALTNDDGVVTYSGIVHDESTRTSIMDALKGVFGADKVRGDITINANAGPAPWEVDLRTTLENFKTSGIQGVFDGDSLKVGGLVGDSDRDGIIASLRAVLPAGLVVGALTDTVGNLVSEATNKTEAALFGLKPGFAAPDLLKILNQSIINFPTDSAEIPANCKALLQQAAAELKQLPPGDVVEIGSYTDNAGDPAANVQLTQQRADAVRAALVQAGVDPSMLVAKGYGSASPIAGNDTFEGRFRNRRVEYRLIKPS
jgi:outer membrane protein OmpA-like peptidoglycan-associated protein/uncharacterized protein YidB (DUF937 family)